MPKFKKSKSTFKKLALAGLVFCCVIGVVLYQPQQALAQSKSVGSVGGLDIKVHDKLLYLGQEFNWNTYFEFLGLEKKTEGIWSKLLNATVKKAMNKIAYDLATYIGSGGEGQKLKFEPRNWKKYLKDIGDEAVGDFLETLGGEWKFNLCEPDFALKIKIGLGLRAQVRPKAPTCTFTKMKKNWEKELKDPKFLSKFQDMFNPTSNDLGIALSLQTNMIEDMNAKVTAKAKDREETQGWLEFSNLTGYRKDVPGEPKHRLERFDEMTAANFSNWTGTALVDAANVFLNQLAITAFDKLMENIAKKSKSEPVQIPEWPGGLTNPEAGPSNQGETGIKAIAGKLLEPNFTERADYDILSELATCLDPKKAGPTNCVINDKFSQAITERLTVGEAMRKGYLNANGVFAFNSDGTEPDYNESYPYRSMIILRKFRILPVGWELAGQYIKTYAQANAAIGTMNLSKLVACFDSNDDYKGYNDNGDQEWCQGLVDPTWVLKAPKNYCKRAGPGPEIVSAQVIGEGKDSKLMIARNANYCGDEQSCIKENYDGSCQFYGYCVEERRTWNFSSPSCEPKYNTCQTFKKADGQSVSYLENTLDYGNCSIDNAGCKAYCTDYDPELGYQCKQSTGNKLYLDRDAEQCKETEEGCHEFVRTKAGLGVNLLFNSSFEEELTRGGWDNFGTLKDDDSYDGLSSLNLSGNLNYVRDVAKDASYSISGEAFSLSFSAKNCGANAKFGFKDASGNEIASAKLENGSDWQRFAISHIYDDHNTGIYKVRPFITPDDSNCLIDALKLERGREATAYDLYRASGLIYEKLAPDYLGCDGSDDPVECQKYAIKCNAANVGCELYTSISDNMSIPAKTTAVDYCPAECVGYNSYVRQETSFESSDNDYFIPSTAQICGAESVGCDEFTNLDKLGAGAEAREYYSSLRQCIKPDASQCSEFYTWEGSDETGYQLKVSQLKKDNPGNPAITEDDSAKCNESIYNLPATDPAHNPDCRQYYNKAGNISYHLYSKTITCSDNCHPYRRTQVNIDSSITKQADCNEAQGDRYWDAANSQCIFCKAGGKWNAQNGACLYEAIPGEGLICSAAQVGCREYTGNAGANMRIVLNNDFEGSKQGWLVAAEQAGDNPNNTSIRVGGNSLFVRGGSASSTVGKLVEEGKSYVLSFIIMPAGATKINSLRLEGDNSLKSEFNVSVINSSWPNNSWKYFKVNLERLDHSVSDNEKLVIEADGDFYLDDLRLTEITDRYYLIKNSWSTPDSCDQDQEGNPSPLYMLGCDQYTDRENTTHNLKSFSGLCQEAFVGCEIMIDTHNSTDYEPQTVKGVVTPADNYDYVVYDKTKECSPDDKGCQRLGAPYNYEGDVLYGDAFLKNNPDKYESILCDQDAVSCQEWSAGDGVSYFKDPGDQVCEWRQATGAGSGGWGWYKKKVKRCEAGNNAGDVCLADGDCPKGTCKLDETDIVCPKSNLKTFGFGGAEISQPAKDNKDYNWAGLCPAAQSGCSEYIDPVSRFSPDLVVENNKATINSYTLYVASSTGPAGSIDCKGDIPLYQLSGPANNLPEVSANSIAVPAGGSVRFYVTKKEGATSDTVFCNISGDAVLRKVAIDYQLKQGVDGKTCNGLVDFETGCVLFNERVQNGASKASLVYNANLTENDGNGIAPQTDIISSKNNANKLLKVSPDRVCDKWLACQDTVQKISGDTEICAKVGICNKFDDNGNCDRFVDMNKTNQTYPTEINASEISDKTGYVKVGYKDTGINMDRYAIIYPDDPYPLGAASTTGLVTSVPNGGFEDASDITEPEKKQITSTIIVNGLTQTTTVEVLDTSGLDIGDPDIPDKWTCSDNSKCEIIDDPVESQKDRLCYQEENGNCFIYAPEGRNYLRLTASYGEIGTAESDYISVLGGKDYYLTAFINTLRLSSGEAQIKIEEFKFEGENFIPYDPAKIYYPDGLTLNKGMPWTLKLGGLKTALETKDIKITLQGYKGDDTGVQGEFYFDFIQIRPVLETKNLWYTPQSCRLYPAEDSLTCDYLDDAGMRRKGWYGHCLEYDRAPGNPNACLLWWPVPHITYRVNETCGDSYANGDEDCDCPQEAKKPEDRNCSAENGINTYWNINPYGTSAYNQYRCLNCLWTDGWCGDAVVQEDLYEEHCDWNEGGSGPNLNGAECWINPNPILNKEFEHDEMPNDGGDTYNDFLYGGPLGCYNSSEPDKKCTFDVSGCNDMLVNAVGDVNSRKDCKDAGGIVWSEQPPNNDPTKEGGHSVTNNAGNIIGNAGDTQKEFFCKFDKSQTCYDNYKNDMTECSNAYNNNAANCNSEYYLCADPCDTQYNNCITVTCGSDPSCVASTCDPQYQTCKPNSCATTRTNCKLNADTIYSSCIAGCITQACKDNCAVVRDNSKANCDIAYNNCGTAQCDTAYENCINPFNTAYDQCKEDSDSELASCGGTVSVCPTGWTQYNNWSKTLNECHKGDSTSCLWGGCGGAKDCCTGYHEFNNIIQEICEYVDETCKKTWFGTRCSTRTRYWPAPIVSVGCY